MRTAENTYQTILQILYITVLESHRSSQDRGCATPAPPPLKIRSCKTLFRVKELTQDHKKRPFFVVFIISFVINELEIYSKCRSHYVKEESLILQMEVFACS